MTTIAYAFDKNTGTLIEYVATNSASTPSLTRNKMFAIIVLQHNIPREEILFQTVCVESVAEMIAIEEAKFDITEDTPQSSGEDSDPTSRPYETEVVGDQGTESSDMEIG